jgi:protease I
MPKVLIVIGDAAEALDRYYPYFRVQEDGYEAVVAAPEKRTYSLVMHEIPPGWDVTKESPSYHMDSQHRVPRRESCRV